MKKLLTLILTLVIMSFAVTASASLLTDNADILSATEEVELTAELESTRDTYGFDIIVFTCDSPYDGYTVQETAEEIYELSGYADDGIMLLLCMETRDWYLLTSGDAITAFNDAGLEYISEEFLPYLSDGRYFEGFSSFNDYCELFLDSYQNGEVLFGDGSYEEYSDEEFDIATEIAFSLMVGGVIALIITLILWRQLKSVKSQSRANSYEKQDSFVLSESRDIFLYKNMNRIRKQQNSSSSGGSTIHRSSSGRSFGGRGGKF